jgi:hypothetical protein
LFFRKEKQAMDKQLIKTGDGLKIANELGANLTAVFQDKYLITVDGFSEYIHSGHVQISIKVYPIPEEDHS